MPTPLIDTAPRRPLRVGVWNFYAEICRDGFLFHNPQVSLGANLLQPWCDLYRRGQAEGVDFLTLDQVADPATLDAVVFMDRPRPGDALAEAALRSPIRKYLHLFECELIKPDNWDSAYHAQFDRVFTWHDGLVDGSRYLKQCFTVDLQPPYDFAALRERFDQRKLCTLVASAKGGGGHRLSLYEERVRAIRWFEAEAPQHFDLYGRGWRGADHPSYRGPIEDKLGTLAGYRFSICYENAQGLPGYITEKVMDCLRGGSVPVYGGAPNIARWLPADCFIDLRRFNTYPALFQHLSAMGADEHGAYLSRIEAFLNGEGARPFGAACLADTLMDVVRWDTQAPAGERPAPRPGLRQDPQTLRIETSDADARPPAPAVAPAAPVSSPQATCRNLKRPDLVVYIGYGHELPTFTRARALWQFYLQHFPGIRAIFVRSTSALPRGTVHDDGHDLLVGLGPAPSTDEAHAVGYAQAGVWSTSENRDTIFRQLAVYRHLLERQTEPFYLFQTTVTSVVDFRGLCTALDALPPQGCFAGQLGRMNAPPELAGLVFASGANSLFSSDLMRVLLQRYDPNHAHADLPNDVWQAVALSDVPRRALPLFSFTQPRDALQRWQQIPDLTRRLMAMGHYHFRVKTPGHAEEGAAREDTDPWIMASVMATVLSTPSSPRATLGLLGHREGGAGTGTASGIAPYLARPGAAATRNHPLDDGELARMIAAQPAT